MERLGRAPASDAVSTGISACRHVSTKANWGRFLDLSVPIASLISELSPLPAKLPVSKCYGWPRCRSITFVREYSASAGITLPVMSRRSACRRSIGGIFPFAGMRTILPAATARRVSHGRRPQSRSDTHAASAVPLRGVGTEARVRRSPLSSRQEHSMNLGAFSISLAVKDIEASTGGREHNGTGQLHRGGPGRKPDLVDQHV